MAEGGNMDKISIEEAIKNTEYNRKHAQKYPDKQKKCADEYIYSDPNDYEEMVELYTYYGFQYSRSLWAYQQVIYEEANKKDERLKN